jgi:hypothetical protein
VLIVVLFDLKSILEAIGAGFANLRCLPLIVLLFHPGCQISDPGSNNNKKEKEIEKFVVLPLP